MHHKSALSSKRRHQHGVCYSGRIMDLFSQSCRFSIFCQISHVRTCKNFHLLNYHRECQFCIKNARNGFRRPHQHGECFFGCTFSDRIIDFRYFLRFHSSEPAIIFSYSTLKEHVSYASKKLLTKQKTTSTWCVFHLKDYGWFLIELSIFDFSANFTGPDLQKFSAFELSSIMHQKSS